MNDLAVLSKKVLEVALLDGAGESRDVQVVAGVNLSRIARSGSPDSASNRSLATGDTHRPRSSSVCMRAGLRERERRPWSRSRSSRRPPRSSRSSPRPPPRSSRSSPPRDGSSCQSVLSKSREGRGSCIRNIVRVTKREGLGKAGSSLEREREWAVPLAGLAFWGKYALKRGKADASESNSVRVVVRVASPSVGDG